MIYSMTDTIIQKLPQADATELFTTILQCYVGKVKSLDLIFQDVGSRLETSKDQMNIDRLDVSFIEKDRPVSNTYYATENPADILRGAFFFLLFR